MSSESVVAKVKTYMVNEIFYSLQGEGVRAGTPNVFVRFTGCNMRCEMEAGEKSPGGFDCDTEFESGRKLSAQEILQEATEIGHGCNNVIFTGGEPALQVDGELTQTFIPWYKSIETNGSVLLNEDTTFQWITVSPKVAEHAIRQKTAHEVKYVRGYGQAVPKTVVTADNYLISPAFDGNNLDRRTLDWCVNLVRENPQWRLSLQQHKQMMVR